MTSLADGVVVGSAIINTIDSVPAEAGVEARAAKLKVRATLLHTDEDCTARLQSVWVQTTRGRHLPHCLPACLPVLLLLMLSPGVHRVSEERCCQALG